jgi:hypothetical protein
MNQLILKIFNGLDLVIIILIAKVFHRNQKQFQKEIKMNRKKA